MSGAAREAVGFEPLVEDVELRTWVERCLGERVQGFERRILGESTSFACELLTVRTDARSHELFFKDYGRCRLPRESAEGARREVQVYRHLLGPLQLGTPAHVGSLLEEEGRTWLLLERVPGARLAERGEGAWLAAADWLARLQARAAGRGILRAPPAFLAVHDAAALLATAEEAVRAVAQLDLLLERRLQEALDGYEEVAEALARQPRTLVHGSFRPENVLVDPGSAPERIAPIDWEHAALGSALHDLAFLSAGLGRRKSEELFAAFRGAAAREGLELPPAEEDPELVTVLRLHKLLRSLGRAQRWSYARETIEHLVAFAGQLSLELQAARRTRAPEREVRAGCQREAPLHPALSAWRALSGGQPGGSSVERLRGRFFGRKGRVVYRLGKIGPGGIAVVAKRCQPRKAAIEQHVYRTVLPRLGVSAPRFLGCVPDAQATWMFLEDAGSTRLCTDDPAQRAVALRWLAALHAAGRELSPAGLPDRGEPRFRAVLGEAHEAVRSALARPTFSGPERARLGAVVSACERVASGWATIQTLCAAMPATFVHGDFTRKNLLLRQSGPEPILLPIDWEFSGWGLPAVDLGCLLRVHASSADLAVYRDALGGLGLPVDEAALLRWLSVGRLLRALVSIHWASASLAYGYMEKPLANLDTYRSALERACDELRI